MTPQRRRDFEDQWPELARRLEFFLARSGVHGDMRDDVIQDTALRLYRMWMRVENDRSAWPLTKTIALNLVRDASRRRASVEISWEVPDLPANNDVESSGMARIELRRIEKALQEMSPAHRSLLLEEVGGEAAPVPTSPAAEKMMRMRARKRLIALLEKVSALDPREAHGVPRVGIGSRDGTGRPRERVRVPPLCGAGDGPRCRRSRLGVPREGASSECRSTRSRHREAIDVTRCYPRRGLGREGCIRRSPPRPA